MRHVLYRGVTLVFLTLFLASQAGAVEKSADALLMEQLKLRHDPSIKIELFARVAKARHMAFDDLGNLFISQARAGRVSALPDADNDGRADTMRTILSGRRAPHGLAFVELESGYYLYVAEETQVVRLRRESPPFAYGAPEVVVADIPSGGHFTRTLKIKDGKLYLSVGSSCNVCEEKEPVRAAISRYNLDGSDPEIFASGLRNSVGIEFSPYDGDLWGVNNGRDWQGDDHPREELNRIRFGKHYGWPYCYEDRKPDPDFGGRMDCSKTEVPAHTFTAHMAPLGLAFYQTGALPVKYDNSLFIAFHGSWNRSKPAGYKVVRLGLSAKGEIISEETWIDGWLLEDGSPSGRPVDVEVSPKGELFLSDDFLGAVYRISGK
ncbi:MAG: oxidoreductase [Candidatus Nitrohelix vancouverensis]|uniref:Oxidoreductase n=1 Tax=Candidatus Nitrohelix vancouverensis TaxID=2705534 RepID=A0A7T0G2D9_9BACT|nr:MAG: oxidoreductase [Candidatus Nitrohelix vancouverensis]